MVESIVNPDKFYKPNVTPASAGASTFDWYTNLGYSNIYTRLLDFGEMDIHADNLDKFWLGGNSNITPFQQIYFLQRLYQSQLPLCEDTMDKVRQMMLLEENTGYKLFGKTGWGEHNGKDIGWFVGYMQTASNVFFFATNIEPTSVTDMSSFAAIRVSITKQILLEYM